MKRFKAIPGKGIVASTRAITSSYTPRYGARYGEDEITEDEIEYLMEKYGGKPVKKYFIANPAFYGEGFYTYGTDYAASFYELDNGKYVEWSSYTGEKEYKNAAEMQATMEAIEDEIDAEVAEYESEYED